jgi:hypothetical protein
MNIQKNDIITATYEYYVCHPINNKLYCVNRNKLKTKVCKVSKNPVFNS